MKLIIRVFRRTSLFCKAVLRQMYLYWGGRLASILQKDKNHKEEYPIDFVLVLLLLLMIQEKTNRADAYMFKQILDELLKDNMDIFSIVSTSTFRGR